MATWTKGRNNGRVWQKVWLMTLSLTDTPKKPEQSIILPWAVIFLEKLCFLLPSRSLLLIRSRPTVYSPFTRWQAVLYITGTLAGIRKRFVDGSCAVTIALICVCYVLSIPQSGLINTNYIPPLVKINRSWNIWVPNTKCSDVSPEIVCKDTCEYSIKFAERARFFFSSPFLCQCSYASRMKIIRSKQTKKNKTEGTESGG